MDHTADSDDLEERWQRMFNEFQDFRSQRRERQHAARDDLDAKQQEIDDEISRVRNDQTKHIEAIREESAAEQRHIEEQTDIEIKILQDVAQRKIAELQKETEKDIQLLKVDIEKQTQELERKRTSRKRKHEEDNRDIEYEFSSRLKVLDRQLRASALPETPPPSATRESPNDPLQVNAPSTDPPSLADSRPHEEIPGSRRANRHSLPPLRLTEPELPSCTALASDTPAPVAKKHRFEGFAKDGCITCKRRARLCDCTKPVCGKCKADGRECLWPQQTAPQQLARNDARAASKPRGESEAPRAPSLRPSHFDFRARAHPDLLPAFAYDASRRPSQKVMRLDHSVPQVDPKGRDQETGPDSGDSSAGQPSVRTSPRAVSSNGPSAPPRQQPQRSQERPRSPAAQKTITYEEVLENVQKKDSPEKHHIVEWPPKSNKWYILRCDKHDKNFGENPFTSARSHLYSEAHGYVERVQDNTVRMLGILVTGCDAKRAKINNLAYKKALGDGYKPKKGNMKRPHKERPRARGVSRHARSRSKSGNSTLGPAVTPSPFDGIIDPIPGEVYQGAQRQPGRSERQWYLVVCLPLDDWRTIGIDGTLKESPLAKSMPSCYKRIFLRNSEPVALDWALDFQINGPRAKERKFPCLILRPGLEIPPWDQEFSIPPEERFLSWVGASSLRRRWFKHPWKTLPSSTKGIENGEDVARKYRRRLEAYRASRGEPRLGVNSRNHHNEVDSDGEDTSEAHDQLRTVAEGSGEAQGSRAKDRGQQSDRRHANTRQGRGSHHASEDSIVVISSSRDESESSLSPVPSEYDQDAFNSSYSPRSASSDGRNASVDPTIVMEDFDLGDYNDPPRSPSNTGQIGDDSQPGGHANDGVDDVSRDGPVGTPSAVEALRAIQAELIPGYYEEGHGRVKESTAPHEQSDPLLLFPGLATRSTHEEEDDSDV